MSYYHTCPYCGANLDPGERCDCRDEEKELPGATNTEQLQAEKTLTGPVSASNNT